MKKKKDKNLRVQYTSPVAEQVQLAQTISMLEVFSLEGSVEDFADGEDY